MRVVLPSDRQSVQVEITSFGGHVASATITLSDHDHQRSEQVSFDYTENMTAGQMEFAALKKALTGLDELAGRLRSEISDREAKSN